MKSRTKHQRLTVAAALLCTVFASARAKALAGELVGAITADDVEWSDCAAWGDGVEQGVVSRDALEALLGLGGNTASPVWSTGKLAGETRHFRIAFRRPVPVGTIVTAFDSPDQFVSALREDATAPGDLADDTQWWRLPTGSVKTLPLGTTVRALRFTHKSHELPWAPSLRSSQMAPVLLLRDRFYDVARMGTVDWRQTPDGKDDVWLAYWPVPRAIAGFVMLDRAPAVSRIEWLSPDTGAHPATAGAAAWRADGVRISHRGWVITGACGGLDTRSLRLRSGYSTPGASRKSKRPPIAVLVALDAHQAVPTSFVPSPPLAVCYDMPMDGFAAISISREGHHVRRLVAEVERAAGPNVQHWDLKTDTGAYVAPGLYRWRGIVRPPLRLTYEMTVYNAGRPPWRAPVPGGGWWMADHSAPFCVCAVGDRMLFGAAGAEFGTGLIATDMDGRKVWHADHGGATRLTSDGRYAYAVHNDSVVRIDPASGFAAKEVLRFKYTDEIPGHAAGYIVADRSGVACKPGTLCVSYNGPEPPWIRSAIGPGDIDLGNCFPPPKTERTHDTALNPGERILSTFLTITSSQQSCFGDAVAKGPMAGVLLLALRREVPVGSVVVPRGDIEVWALRPGKPLPTAFRGASPTAGDGLDRRDDLDDVGLDGLGELDTRFDERVWFRLESSGGNRPEIAVPATGIRSKVFAFTGADLERIDYSLLLDRRYRNVTPSARLTMLEGRATASGGWTTTRPLDSPISYGNPAIAGLVWDKPTPMRGFMVVHPMAWAGVDIDVWTGPEDAAITDDALKDDDLWTKVAGYRKSQNSIKFGWHTDRVIRGDFGETRDIRALRYRIVEPPKQPATAPAPAKGGFEYILTFQPIGNDPELPKTYAKRITVIDLPKNGAPSAYVRSHLSMPAPVALAFDAGGVLFASTAEGIVRIKDVESQTDPPQFEMVVPPEAVRRPRALAFDADGLLYVLDGAAKHIGVFDPATGGRIRTIGKPNGAAGWYDPAGFTEPVAMSIDANGKIWVVEQHFQPKRISRWARDGTFERDFMGPTNYGGGGKMDPGDRTVVNHLGMKFRIDYEQRTWKLESRLSPYRANFYSPERVTYRDSRRYLIGDQPCVTSFGDDGPISVICEEAEGAAVPLVCTGVLGGWDETKRNADLRQAFAKLEPNTTAFIWTDLDRDHAVQVAEVHTLTRRPVKRAPFIGDDLSLNWQEGFRLRPCEIRDDGLPLFDPDGVEPVPEMRNTVMVTNRGDTFVMGHTLLDTDGSALWTYPDQFMGVQASMKTPWGFYGRPPGVLSGGMLPIGYVEVAGETLYCVGGNNGDYYAFTRDGLLAATIVGGPAGYGRRFFCMPECEPGKTDLSGLRKTVEDFQGHICRADDGNVYTILGKNHITVTRVDGLDQMKRIDGTLTVTDEDVRRAMAWSAEATRIRQALREPKIATVPLLPRPPVIDGATDVDWPGAQPLQIRLRKNDRGDVVESWFAKLAFDQRNLYVAADVTDESPMLNGCADRRRPFQGGDGLDLHLELRTGADASRTDPAPGDVRIVLVLAEKRPLAMLYRYRVGGESLGGEPFTFTSPMGETRVDEIVEVANATVKIASHDRRWTLEAALPWASLAATAPSQTTVIHGDVGVLESDQNGMNTVGRQYWANTSHVIMGDLPAEARINPQLWGEFRFVIPDIGDVLDDVLRENGQDALPRLDLD